MTVELAAVVATRIEGDRVRAMFGGWAIYREAEMVAIVYEGRTYLKAVTEAAQAPFVAAGMGWRSDRGQTKASGPSGRSHRR